MKGLFSFFSFLYGIIEPTYHLLTIYCNYYYYYFCSFYYNYDYFYRIFVSQIFYRGVLCIMNLICALAGLLHVSCFFDFSDNWE